MQSSIHPYSSEGLLRSAETGAAAANFRYTWNFIQNVSDTVDFFQGPDGYQSENGSISCSVPDFIGVGTLGDQ
jgi:hypothetical protein